MAAPPRARTLRLENPELITRLISIYRAQHRSARRRTVVDAPHPQRTRLLSVCLRNLIVHNYQRRMRVADGSVNEMEFSNW
jgi:hypothetical protein